MIDWFLKDIADQRDQIIFGEPFSKEKYPGGIRRFDNLTLPQIEELKEIGVIRRTGKHNEAPSCGEVIDFLRSRTTDGWYVHGYCVSPARHDFRISFEGVGKSTPPNDDDTQAFSKLFKWADEFRVDKDGLLCWYD